MKEGYYREFFFSIKYKFNLIVFKKKKELYIFFKVEIIY